MTDNKSLALTALNRIALGPSTEDLSKLDHFDLERFVDHQLHPDSIMDLDCDRRIAQAGLSTLSKPLKQLWADHRVAADKLRDAQGPRPDAKPSHAPGHGPQAQGAAAPGQEMMDDQKLRMLPARQTEMATWLRAVYSQKQLQEVLADFWHNHFNVFAWDGPVAPVFVHYDRDVIRPHLFGNFRAMLEAVAKSPAMSLYLDGFLNQSGNPNENYARELFELHTLGAENYLGTGDRKKVPGFARGEPVGYVDGDVYEAARCFTGWRVDATQKEAGNTGEFAYYDGWHDRFQKIVLGRSLSEYQPPLKDGNDVLDLLAAHPGTARYVCRKLCRRLVADNPPKRLVEEAARVFREKSKAPDQLRLVTRAVILSPEFRAARRTKIKRPFESTAGILRATGAEFFPSEPFLNQYQRSGQRLFAWRSPDGYPDAALRWGGTAPMLERWRIASLLLTGKVDGIKIDVPQPEGEAARSASATARYWSQRLLGAPLAPPRLKAIENFLAKDPGNGDRLRGAAALVMMSPEFLWR